MAQKLLFPPPENPRPRYPPAAAGELGKSMTGMLWGGRGSGQVGPWVRARRWSRFKWHLSDSSLCAIISVAGSWRNEVLTVAGLVVDLSQLVHSWWYLKSAWRNTAGRTEGPINGAPRVPVDSSVCPPPSLHSPCGLQSPSLYGTWFEDMLLRGACTSQKEASPTVQFSPSGVDGREMLSRFLGTSMPPRSRRLCTLPDLLKFSARHLSAGPSPKA